MNMMNMIDAQSAMGFVLSQTSYIEPGVYATKYPDIQYRSLIPIDTSGHPFAASVTFFSSDKFGAADWINGNADDIPKAGTTRTKHETQVHTAGIGYGYGFEEIGRAQMMGVNLPADDAAAARRAAEEMIDRVALQGDTNKGFTGLFDANGVTAYAPTTGAWDTATPVQIIKDLNEALLNVFNGTNTAAMADTLLLPWSKYNLIATTPFSEHSDETILSWFKRNNVYTVATGQQLTIRGMRGLDTAGAAGVTRMIAYRYSPEVLKLHIPMPHRFLQPWQSGPMRIDVPGVFRLGGLDVRLPKEVVYVDGI